MPAVGRGRKAKAPGDGALRGGTDLDEIQEEELLLMAAPFAEREKGRVYELDVSAPRRVRSGVLDAGALKRSFAPAAKSSRFGEGGLVAVAEGRLLVGAPRSSSATGGESGEMLGSAFLMGL